MRTTVRAAILVLVFYASSVSGAPRTFVPTAAVINFGNSYVIEGEGTRGEIIRITGHVANDVNIPGKHQLIAPKTRFSFTTAGGGGGDFAPRTVTIDGRSIPVGSSPLEASGFFSGRGLIAILSQPAMASGSVDLNLQLGLRDPVTELLTHSLDGSLSGVVHMNLIEPVILDPRAFEIAFTQYRLGKAARCETNSMGDLDGNGIVEFADFLVLSANFGNPVLNHGQGDVDCDGTVEFADFLTLSANFGTKPRTGELVPEPSAFTSSALVLFALSGCPRRRQRRSGRPLIPQKLRSTAESQ